MTEKTELYELVCKKRFDDAQADRREILRLLRGRNGEPGVLDDVRNLKKAYRALIGIALFILGTLCVQLLAWVMPKILT